MPAGAGGSSHGPLAAAIRLRATTRDHSLPGGRIWVAPDSWGSVRRTHLRYNPSWGLTIDGEEILRVWPTPDHGHDTFDIVVGPCSIELPQLSLLLVPLVCWIVMSEGATLISC